MVTIKILEHVSTASSYEDGGIIFSVIEKNLSEGNTVEVSFLGIASVPSAFVNSAIVQLLEKFPLSTIKERVRFTNTTRHINQLIKSRIEFAATQDDKNSE